MHRRVKVTVQIDYFDEIVPDEIMSVDEINEDEIDEVVRSYFIRTTTSSSESTPTCIAAPENLHKIPEDFDCSAFILLLKYVDEVPEIIGSVTDVNMILSHHQLRHYGVP